MIGDQAVLDYIDSLKVEHEVFVGCNTDKRTGTVSYFALVMPKLAYVEKINELNARYYLNWRRAVKNASLNGRRRPEEPEPVAELDDLDMMSDPRYYETDTLWGALAVSEERMEHIREMEGGVLYYAAADLS